MLLLRRTNAILQTSAFNRSYHFQAHLTCFPICRPCKYLQHLKTEKQNGGISPNSPSKLRYWLYLHNTKVSVQWMPGYILLIMSKKSASNIRLYDPTRLISQQQADGTSFISLMLCSVGMFMRSKLIIWISIFFILSTFCRRRNGTSIVHYLINLVMIIFGLVTNYMMVPPGHA